MSPDPPLLGATPVLPVADYRRARAFYVHRLGFHLREEAGDPPRFAVLERGAAVLFLDGWHGGPGGSTPRARGGWTVYLHVHALDALLEEYLEREVVPSAPRRETVYGTLEFEVTDPDGNVLCFGQPLP